MSLGLLSESWSLWGATEGQQVRTGLSFVVRGLSLGLCPGASPVVVNNGEMEDVSTTGPLVLRKEAPGFLGRVGCAAGAIGVGREGLCFSQAKLVVV